MGTVLVDYYDAECVRCGWKHRVMYGGGLGTDIAHTLAVARHANATYGKCTAYPDEIRDQQAVAKDSAAQGRSKARGARRGK
jgi:hypothetical protein